LQRQNIKMETQFGAPQNILLLQNILYEEAGEGSFEFVKNVLPRAAGTFMAHIRRRQIPAHFNRVYRDSSDATQLKCLNSEFLNYIRRLYADSKTRRIPIGQVGREMSEVNDEQTVRTEIKPGPRRVLDDRNTSSVDDQFVHWGGGDAERSVGAITNERPTGWYVQRPRTYRDDSAGTAGHPTHVGCVGRATDHIADRYDPVEGGEDNFTNDHINRLLQTPYIQALNADDNTVLKSTFERGRTPRAIGDVEGYNVEDPQHRTMWSDGDCFAGGTPDDIARLMSRRTFRTANRMKVGCRDCNSGRCNTHSVAQQSIMQAEAREQNGETAEAQIPWYRKTAHRRNYERDVEEDIGGFERDCHVRGHDMESLYCRTENREFRFEC
jgi:hypothetical protein